MKHEEDLKLLKLVLSDPNFTKKQLQEKEKLFLIGITVHCADISNPTKNWLIQAKWGYLLYEEFFNQGVEE